MRRFVVGLVFVAVAGTGCRGRHEGPGTVTGEEVPAAVVAARGERQAEASARLAPAPSSHDKQILFGDLHVHTTFSIDAFLQSLPLVQGEGAHPPADACDFARFCSGLDFWSINDHAEGISPQHWRETRESIRQCNAVAGDARNPDVVAFLGWEWTQVGSTPENHYGHKNVIFRETADDRVPSRPISSIDPSIADRMRGRAPMGLWQRLMVSLLDWSNRQRYYDLGAFLDGLLAMSACPPGVDTRELPPDCRESAVTPRELFDKLDQWGFESMVIPHGTTWGFYTPPGSTFDKQLRPDQKPERQPLFEIYSGHGNSEEYRSWKAIDRDEKGDLVCPAPTPDYEPCCWRAGEIIRARCDGDVSTAECDRRVAKAQHDYLEAGAAGRVTIPGTTIEEWKDCGQCRDCFNPSFTYRPGNSAQYALALTNFDEAENPRRFRFGFLGSSDNHSARPGTGYKEYARRQITEASGARDAGWRGRLQPDVAPEPESHPIPEEERDLPAFFRLDHERQASFFMTGGLVALHSDGRDRDSIWKALERREVYGTSGERILLWFDLLNGAEGPLPMGSSTSLDEAPKFRVRAVGAFVQKPGCPDHSLRGLSADRLARLCLGECYNPSDERRRITRIEVVRIRPQVNADESIGSLIEDPWRRFECPDDPAGCAVEFEDPEFVESARSALYYVRAIQEPTPAVNAGALRCETDDVGNCVSVNPCYGDYRTSFDDDCLTENEERAWSSPVYVDVAPVRAAARE